MSERKRLIVKVTHDTIPQIKDRYPFVYLERGRLEVDDSSVKWIDCDGLVIRLPIATITTLLLGPGTSITHESIKVLAAANCTICWVGEDSLLFYATGVSPTSDTRKMRMQMSLSCDPEKSLLVARRMFEKRFPEENLVGKKLKEMMGMEGSRVRKLYERKAEQYHVNWNGRSYIPGKFENSDLVNKILTSSNAALYALLTSCLYSMGFSPHIGFIHSGSPLPFVYDLADLYKEHLCIDLAFSLAYEMAGKYNKYRVSSEFRQRVIDSKLLENLNSDINEILGEKTDGSRDC